MRPSAAYGIEARDGYALGRIVDDEVRAGQLFEGTDVASFATDDTALQIVRRNMDSRNRILGRVVRCDALDGKAQYLTRFLIGFSPRTGLCIADDGGRLVRYLFFQGIEQLRFRFVGRHARNALEAVVDFLGSVFEIALPTFELTLHRRDLMFARIKRFNATIQRFFTLRQTVFGSANLTQPLFVLRLGILLHLQNFVFGFDDRFPSERFGLFLRICNEALRLLCSPFRRRIDDETRDNKAESDTDDSPDYEP